MKFFYPVIVTKENEDRFTARFPDLEMCTAEAGSFDEVLEDLKKRDYNDSHREIAPLKPAENGVIIDTSYLTFEESVSKIIETAKEILDE